MEKVANLQKLPNYNTYLLELISAVNKQDEKAINQIFNKIDEELKKNRNAKRITTARSELKWNDPEAHFSAVQREEAADLKMEFDDNLGLFQLACLVQYKPVMTIEFAKMIKNLNDIRQKTNIKIERSKISWMDPEAHFRGVKAEEKADLRNEINDLLSLYNIAQSANYTEGIELITARLNEIAPNLVDDLTPKTNGTARK